VVVVSEYEPDPDLWAELESLGQVYFVLGAPRMQSVLRRAGITTCSSIIILLDSNYHKISMQNSRIHLCRGDERKRL